MSDKKKPIDTQDPEFDLDKFLNMSDNAEKLDDKQFEVLEIFLEQHPQGMHMEILDGFFCGLICGPESKEPEDYINYIFGGNTPKYESSEQEEQIRHLLRQHWDYIKTMLEGEETYYPFLYSDENFKVSGNDWAFGFVLGVDKFKDSWEELLAESQEKENLLTPILSLYFESSPENAEGLIHAEDREEIVKKLIDNLPKIYQYFNNMREVSKPSTLH